MVYGRASAEQCAAKGERPFHRPESRRMTEKDLPALSIADLQSLLRRREVSAREVIDALRARIAAVDREIGAYLSLGMDVAAKEAEKSNVDLPPAGLPLAIKAIINFLAHACSCAT